MGRCESRSEKAHPLRDAPTSIKDSHLGIAKAEPASNFAGYRMRDDTQAGLGWAAVAFVFVIALFGIILIGHAPKWPIYVSVLVWWGFVVYRANQK
jgi:hypothetical protein